MLSDTDLDQKRLNALNNILSQSETLQSQIKQDLKREYIGSEKQDFLCQIKKGLKKMLRVHYDEIKQLQTYTIVKKKIKQNQDLIDKNDRSCSRSPLIKTTPLNSPIKTSQNKQKALVTDFSFQKEVGQLSFDQNIQMPSNYDKNIAQQTDKLEQEPQKKLKLDKGPSEIQITLSRIQEISPQQQISQKSQTYEYLYQEKCLKQTNLNQNQNNLVQSEQKIQEHQDLQQELKNNTIQEGNVQKQQSEFNQQFEFQPQT